MITNIQCRPVPSIWTGAVVPPSPVLRELEDGTARETEDNLDREIE